MRVTKTAYSGSFSFTGCGMTSRVPTQTWNAGPVAPSASSVGGRRRGGLEQAASAKTTRTPVRKEFTLKPVPMIRTMPFRIGSALLVLALGSACVDPEGEPPRLNLDRILDVRHPSGPVWSPDGSRVFYVEDRNQQMDLFSAAPGEAPRRLTSWGDDYETISGLFFGADGLTLHYERNGRLWRMRPDEAGTLEPVFPAEPGGEGDYALSPDGGRLAFVRDGDLHVLRGTAELRLTRTDAAEANPVWSPDGRFLAFTAAETVASDDVREIVGDKLRFRKRDAGPTELLTIPAIPGGVARRIASGPAGAFAARWISPWRLIFQEVSPDFRTRSIRAADLRAGSVATLHETHDPRWWSLAYLGAEPRPSPDGAWAAFVDDASGWDRLMVVSPGGGAAHALTPEGQDVRRFAWSPDGRFLAFDANPEHPGRRALFVLDAADLPEAAPRLLAGGRGTNVQPANAGGFVLTAEHGGFSPDGSSIVFQRAGPREPPDLWRVPTDGSAEPERLTRSLPEEVEPGWFTEGEFVRFPARELGRDVPGYLFAHEDLDRSHRHPAIVWVHGDGIAQNYEGWHVRRDYGAYHAFHQLLAQEGYVVLMPDYRGSVGYGRDFRLDSYRDVGGGDYQDVAAAGDFLRTLDFVDPERIGIWGLSYGGFMTMQALTLDPTLFAAGVNVAGVGDFELWHEDPGGGWVVGRMGRPEDEPEGYELGAPARRVGRIERPLLILHGTADVNVPYFESLNLVDLLLREGKDFDFVTYPGEFHYFHREHVLRDAWSRVRRFFDRNLKN